MTTFKTITGSPAGAAGIAVMDDAGQISYIESPAVGKANTTSPKLAAGIYYACGNNINGMAVASGGQVQYLTSLGNGSASWKKLQAIDNVTIGGITGDNQAGFTVINDAGDKVYQLNSVDSKAEWKALTAPLPFNAGLVAGDSKGLVIIGKKGDSSKGEPDNRDQVARTVDCCTWTPLTGVPFSIDLICGNATSGFVVYGEGQLAVLDGTKWTFATVTRPNFAITAMSGNPKDGIVALVGNGDVVAYCSDLVKGPWIISMIPKPGPAS